MNYGYIGNYKSKIIFYIENDNELKLILSNNEIYQIFEYNKILTNVSANDKYKLLSYIIYLGKIYFILYSLNDKDQIELLKAFIFDLESKIPYEILLPPSLYEDIKNKISIKDHITLFESNKMFLIGGIMQDKTHIQKLIYSFDLTTYKFQKEQFLYYSLTPRYCLTGTTQANIFYILGGYTSLFNKDENICESLQFANYDEGKLSKFTIAYNEGEKPILMIDANLYILKDKYVISFSGYQYSKLWILNNDTNKGKNYDLRKFNFDDFNNQKQNCYLTGADFIGEKSLKIFICIFNFLNEENKFINIKDVTIELE